MPTILKVDGDGWRLEIVGKIPDLPKFLKLKPSTIIKASRILKMECFCEGGGEVRRIADGELIEPLFYESVGYDIHFEKDEISTKIELPNGADSRRIRSFTEHYHLNFGGNVGFAEIGISGPSGYSKIRFEVFSRKADYRTDYLVMRDEISAMLRNLAMSASLKTYSTASPERNKLPTLVEWFALIKSNFEDFFSIAQGISKNPHSSLIKKGVLVDAGRAKKVSRRTIEKSLRRPGNGSLHPVIGISLPRRLEESVSRVTFDTAENRYFKALIRETYRKIRTLVRSQYSGDEDADIASEVSFFASIKSDLTIMQSRLEALMCQPFLKSVADVIVEKPNSMVFHKHPDYARFDKICRIINGGLSFSKNIVPIGVKDTALIYEYWCFLKIVNILEDDFYLSKQNLVKFKRMKIVVALEKGRSSAIFYKHKKTNRELRIVYNRLFNKLPTTAQKPDNVIQFASEDRFYIFDAKYRIQFDKDYLKKYLNPGPMEEDINTMHRYRDAIAIPHPITGIYERGVVIGAAVLFPYPDENDYEGHRFHRSLEQVEIGGIPFLPGSTRMLKEKINQLLEKEYLS